jgi:hypothetical protein
MAQLQSLSNVIFVCSAGTDGQLNDIGANGCFILDNPNTITISVGCVSNNFMAGGNQAFQFDKELDVIFPILPYVSFKSNGKSFDQESDITCSYATGIVTAIISLLFSAGVLKSGSDKTEIVNAIKANSQKYAAGNSFLNPTIL